MMKYQRMHNYLTDYESFHRTKGNKMTHYFGIPMIVFSILGFLHAVGIQPQNPAGMLFLVLVLGFYGWLHPLWGSLFTLLAAGLFVLSGKVPLLYHVVLFVAGWILQGIGHYKYEKVSPAFLKNFTHLLIGPFWIFRCQALFLIAACVRFKVSEKSE